MPNAPFQNVTPTFPSRAGVGGPIGLPPISIAETRMLNVSYILHIIFQVVGKLLRGFITLFRNKSFDDRRFHHLLERYRISSHLSETSPLFARILATAQPFQKSRPA